MSVYQRYFRVLEGPLLDKIYELRQEQLNASKVVDEFANRIGAKAMYWRAHRGIAGFQFRQQPCQRTWKKRDKNGLYWPRKTTSEGKALWQEINSLPVTDPLDSALGVVGLYADTPCIFDVSGRKAYTCSLTGFLSKRLFFVQVPWKYVDPQDLKEYADNHDRSDIELDHLLWKPSADLKEVQAEEMYRCLEEARRDARTESEST